MSLREELLDMSDRYLGRAQELLILAVARIDRLEKQIAHLSKQEEEQLWKDSMNKK